jgi:hypothetical protein
MKADSMTSAMSRSQIAQGIQTTRYQMIRPFRAYKDNLSKAQKLLELVGLWGEREFPVTALSHRTAAPRGNHFGLSLKTKAIINGQDPNPIILNLDALTSEVKNIVGQLKPSELLSGLNEPFQAAKEIVEAHGGTVSVDSAEGKGSTFSFTLTWADPIAKRESSS